MLSRTVSSRMLFCLLAFLLFGAKLFAQGDMRFFGTATKGGQPLSGATVTVDMDGKQIINLTTGRNGKFKFTIDIGHTYRINFSAPGCVNMYMTMDLKVPPDKAWIYPDYQVEIPFFEPNDPKVNTDLYAKKPFIKVIYDGQNGFHDDPSYRFIDEIFKNPAEEERKKEEERVRKEAEQREKDRLAEEERLRRLAEEQQRNLPQPVLTQPTPTTPTQTTDPTTDPSMETDAIRLEREKENKENQKKDNQSVRAAYENNLLKMVAESEKKNNIEKYNQMKDEAEVNSVVSSLRRQAAVKGERAFLIDQEKERQRQTRANIQVRELQVRQLIETSAFIQREISVAAMKPVAAAGPLSYVPSPHFVTTLRKGFWTDEKCVALTWPGGKRTVFKIVKYWWTSYFYIDDKEVEEKVYQESLDAYHSDSL
jgi:hypothetical protein